MELVADITRLLRLGEDSVCEFKSMRIPGKRVHEGPHGYFYRIGSAKRKMPPEMLARLFQQRSQTRLVCFDEQVVSRAATHELIPSLYSRFRSELSSADDGEFLRKLHFVAVDVDGVMRPTVSGVLFATENPEEYLPSAFIQAVCYRGTERNANDQLDARDITGPLDLQIIEACRFVERNMKVAAIKNPARIDIPQYAMNAVFEAIVNAVAHRDYSISGAKIRLHMFSDRLEIFSPGGLPNSLTIDEIGERQFSRNELICTCLSRCALSHNFSGVTRTRIMDKRGEGVPVIISASGKLSGATPEYRLLGNSELMLTIYSAPIEDRSRLHDIATTKLAPDETISGGIKPESGGIKPESGGIKYDTQSQDEALLAIVSKHPGSKVDVLQSIMGSAYRSIERSLARLVADRKIEYRGSKKTGGYFILEKKWRNAK